MGVVIGITGGIATGKTTVARMFEDLGAKYLDADQIARDVVSPGSEALERVKEAFGPDVVDSQGRLDRAKVADMIFADPIARQTLNHIIHPYVIDILKQSIHEFMKAASPCDVLVIEIALLFEVNLSGIVDEVLVVSAEQEAQKNRLQMRSELSAEQLDQRIQSQMPVSEKIKRADWVVSTDCSPEETRSQVEAIWRQLLGRNNAGTQPL